MTTKSDQPRELPVVGTRFEQTLHRVLNFLFKRRDIVIDNELYLRRWFLTPRSWPVRVFLHCILRSDKGINFHDHPWDAAFLILARGYIEVVPDGADPLPGGGCTVGANFRSNPWKFAQHACRPGSFRIVAAEHTHRVIIPNGQLPAWTFTFAGRARRLWGFYQDEPWTSSDAPRWLDWRKHLGIPDAKDHPEDIVAPKG